MRNVRSLGERVRKAVLKKAIIIGSDELAESALDKEKARLSAELGRLGDSWILSDRARTKLRNSAMIGAIVRTLGSEKSEEMMVRLAQSKVIRVLEKVEADLIDK